MLPAWGLNPDDLHDGPALAQQDGYTMIETQLHDGDIHSGMDSARLRTELFEILGFPLP